MDLQLTSAEALVVRNALDEYSTLRTESLHRADGSPGHPRFSPVTTNAMRTDSRMADRVMARLAAKIELADKLTAEGIAHDDALRLPASGVTVVLGSDHNIFVELADGRRQIITDIDGLCAALGQARMWRGINESRQRA